MPTTTSSGPTPRAGSVPARPRRRRPRRPRRRLAAAWSPPASERDHPVRVGAEGGRALGGVQGGQPAGGAGADVDEAPTGERAPPRPARPAAAISAAGSARPRPGRWPRPRAAGRQGPPATARRRSARSAGPARWPAGRRRLDEQPRAASAPLRTTASRAAGRRRSASSTAPSRALPRAGTAVTPAGSRPSQRSRQHAADARPPMALTCSTQRPRAAAVTVSAKAAAAAVEDVERERVARARARRPRRARTRQWSRRGGHRSAGCRAARPGRRTGPRRGLQRRGRSAASPRPARPHGAWPPIPDAAAVVTEPVRPGRRPGSARRVRHRGRPRRCRSRARHRVPTRAPAWAMTASEVKSSRTPSRARRAGRQGPATVPDASRPRRGDGRPRRERTGASRRSRRPVPGGERDGGGRLDATGISETTRAGRSPGRPGVVRRRGWRSRHRVLPRSTPTSSLAAPVIAHPRQ